MSLARVGSRFVPPVSPSLVRLIQSQARNRPQSVAIRAGSKTMDYSTLAAVADGFTATLRGAGMQRDDVIGLVAEREPATVALMLAVLQGGASCLPLDTTYPTARLSAMLSDARPRIVLGSEGNQSRLPVQAPWLSLEVLASMCGNLADQETGEIAYVLFTSGSTGRPKGVAMRTSVLAHLIAWHVAHPRLGQAARTLQFAPLSFDVSFQEIWSTLATGGVLVLPSESERKDPYALLDLIARERIERLFLPYVALQALAEAVAAGGSSPTHLKDVITAGEQLRITPAIASLFSGLPDCRLHNHYGPTETHVVTALELCGDPAVWPELPSIGHPLPYVRVRIVDRNLNTRLPGEEGELLLGGDCLAAGYIHRPELTEERFIELEGSRWYRTGDIATLGSDGELEYLGRLDDQIKVNGFRIEPAEIESTLSRHEAVAISAVVVVESTEGKQLVAHVAPRPGQTDDALAAQLLAHCKAQLPPYLIPQRIVIHAALPLTPAGKIDRRALKQGSDPKSKSMPWHEAETIEGRLSALWMHLLGISNIDTKANLFDLGARSLMVVQAVAELRRCGFQKLTVAQVYEHSSIARLSAFLTAMTATSATVKSAPERGQRQRAALARFKPREGNRS
jgi:amino acid adenylation domain-containing protein